jgi:hypothetical protein
MENSCHVKRNVGFFVPLLFVLLVSACASVNPDPFKKYRISLQEAQTGIDAAMSVNYEWTRSGFIDSFSSNSQAAFSQLLIQPGSEYLWTWDNAPLYLYVRQTRTALFELNDAFYNYADLLAKLAGDELISKERFDSMAKDLNTTAISALESLKLSIPSQAVGLFSQAAAEAARLYIENKRQSYLRDAIQKNQANIQDYSDKCISLIQTIRGNIKSYYVDRYDPYEKAWKTAKPLERKNLTENMLALNEQLIDSLRVLQELEKAYSELPKAHTDLANSIGSKDMKLDGIQALYSSALRLQRLYKELIGGNPK